MHHQTPAVGPRCSFPHQFSQHMFPNDALGGKALPSSDRVYPVLVFPPEQPTWGNKRCNNNAFDKVTPQKRSLSVMTEFGSVFIDKHASPNPQLAGSSSPRHVDRPSRESSQPQLTWPRLGTLGRTPSAPTHRPNDYWDSSPKISDAATRSSCAAASRWWPCGLLLPVSSDGGIGERAKATVPPLGFGGCPTIALGGSDDGVKSVMIKFNDFHKLGHL
jgi:hypothetical protein